MTDLLSWLAALPPAARDRALEERLGIASPLPPTTPPGPHLVGYHASGIAPLVRALFEVPVIASDVVIDLGAGLGKAVLVTNLLTGARARGIELQPELVEHARGAALRAGACVEMEHGDARTADLSAGTVFFLYLPFTGPVLAAVAERLRAVAEHHPIVVCALGLDLDRVAPWLVRRPLESFWLAIYDSAATRTRCSPLDAVLAEAIASERALR